MLISPLDILYGEVCAFLYGLVGVFRIIGF